MAQVPGASILSLLAHVPVSREAKTDLVARMCAPSRHYHDIRHLELLWDRHRAFSKGTGLERRGLTQLIACAIAFHDSVYEPSRHDNEDCSAAFWLDVSLDSPLSRAARFWVADAIRASADHLGRTPSSRLDLSRAARSSDRAAQSEAALFWFLDLDLTPLGEPPARFDNNTRLLRLEASHLSAADAERSRLRFLSRLAGAPQLYRSPAIAAHFETAARANFERELAYA